MADPITTFVTFDMPTDSVEAFKTAWLQDAAFIAKQPGQKGGTLYRRVGAGGRVGFVNVAHWESEDALMAAREAAITEQRKDGRDQASLFNALDVLVSAENYLAEVPY